MAYTAENWPITAALLQFPGTDAQGNHVNDAEASAWADVLTEVKDAGFANADLTDSWVRPGDLSPARLAEFKQTADTVGIGIPVISAIRRSVIEERNWEANLAYSHRTIDAAAELGCEVVSFGLHQAITAEQQKQLWFWTIEG
ncbi:MAG TPA: TIM barrel protein, partial [Arthrobacter sp.]|nr:TIM barrel protein [Arthrobacter sp.]